MKFAFVVLLVVIAAVYSQAPLPSDAVRDCISDISADLVLLKKIQVDYEAKNIFALMNDVLTAQPLIEKTIATCKTVTKSDIMALVYMHLTEEQRTCFVNVLTVVVELKSQVDFLKQKKWTQFYTEIFGIAQTSVMTVNECKIAFNS